MALAAGVRVGPYEIQAAIGAGGMGEVYRARDTKLHRDVALKVLREDFALDPDRRARFEREAQLLASLNHPNIAGIHGLENLQPEAGSHPGGHALVLEFVDGPTLADRIAQEPIPLDEALAIARQIAEALQAAHEHGVIHRDLKPANIKLTEDGAVKVLDFGLAKLSEATAAASAVAAGDISVLAALSQSPTLTSPAMTGVGVILGTAAYMSPEQAKGKPADKRADIWAFGCVLFEILSGRQPFADDDVSDTLANVLKGAPDWAALPPGLPAPLTAVLRGCLEKDRRRRIADIAAVQFVLREIDTLAQASPPSAATAPVVSRRHGVFRVAGGVAIGAVLAAGLVAAWLLTVNEVVEPPVRFSLTLTDLELPVNNGRLVAISPDGQTLVYRARPGASGVFRLYRRRLNEFEATLIGEENASNVIFSADSQWIGYVVGNTLRRVPIGGGPSELLVNIPAGTGGFTMHWASDGTLLAGGPRLLRIRPGVNDPETLATAGVTGNIIASPQMLPNNRAAIFTEGSGQNEGRAVHLVNLQTGERRLLLEGAVASRYLPSGHLVFWREGALWAVRFDLDDLAIAGEPALVVEGVRGESGGATQFSIADDGTLVYLPGRPAQGNRRLIWVDRNGTERATGAPMRAYDHPRLSPDARRVVVEDPSSTDLWIFNLEPETLERLTTSPSAERSPVWLTDDRVVFSATRDNMPGVFAQRADGSGSPERLATTPGLLDSLTLHPNGRLLLGRAGEDIWLVPLDGSGPPAPFIQTPTLERNPEFSPNGLWVAYQSNEGGQAQIYVRPAPGRDGPRILVSPDVGADPMWSRDGKELFYYLSAPANLMRVPVDSGEVFRAGRPEPLFDISQRLPMFTLQGRSHDVSDDRGFLMMKVEEEAAADREIHVVVNWGQELRERVPID